MWIMFSPLVIVSLRGRLCRPPVARDVTGRPCPGADDAAK